MDNNLPIIPGLRYTVSLESRVSYLARGRSSNDRLLAWPFQEITLFRTFSFFTPRVLESLARLQKTEAFRALVHSEILHFSRNEFRDSIGSEPSSRAAMNIQFFYSFLRYSANFLICTFEN